MLKNRRLDKQIREFTAAGAVTTFSFHQEREYQRTREKEQRQADLIPADCRPPDVNPYPPAQIGSPTKLELAKIHSALSALIRHGEQPSCPHDPIALEKAREAQRILEKFLLI